MAQVRLAAALAVLALAGALVCLAGCSSQAGSGSGTSVGVPTRMEVGPEADGTTVQLARGQQLDVELPSNPSTGFNWFVSGSLPSQLTSVTDSYEATGEPNVVGSGGTRVLSYSASSSGTGTLKLDYDRPFEKGVPPAKTFTLTVTVQ